eukprot:6205237-Pleurochrysis_carterae.AAC.1
MLVARSRIAHWASCFRIQSPCARSCSAAPQVGASLYELSTAPSRGVPRLLRGGALPFVACSGLMLLVTAFLAVAVSRFVAMRDEDRARSDTSASSDEADAKSKDGAERLFGVSLMSVV